MAHTLQDIQNQIAFEVDSNASISSTDSDWGSRLIPINRAVSDWAQTYDWDVLKKIHNGRVSTSTGNASYVLPSDFKKIDGFPRVVSDGTTAYDLPIVDISKVSQYTDSDKYANILGNDYQGNVMYIHTSTLASGASVQFTYYSVPASLSSVGQVVECPDPSYITQRAMYYIYKQKEDPRFPEARAEADKIMARMIENQNTRGLSDNERQVSVWTDSRYNFRIGRD